MAECGSVESGIQTYSKVSMQDEIQADTRVEIRLPLRFMKGVGTGTQKFGRTYQEQTR